MSIADYRAQRAAMEGIEAPAYMLIANHVKDRAESRQAIAIFDTAEEAQAYAVACRVPLPFRTEEPDMQWGCSRYHRPDCLLYWHNPPDARDVIPLWPWMDDHDAPENPAPPTGEWSMPENARG